MFSLHSVVRIGGLLLLALFLFPLSPPGTREKTSPASKSIPPLAPVSGYPPDQSPTVLPAEGGSAGFTQWTRGRAGDSVLLTPFSAFIP